MKKCFVPILALLLTIAACSEMPTETVDVVPTIPAWAVAACTFDTGTSGVIRINGCNGFNTIMDLQMHIISYDGWECSYLGNPTTDVWNAVCWDTAQHEEQPKWAFAPSPLYYRA